MALDLSTAAEAVVRADEAMSKDHAEMLLRAALPHILEALGRMACLSAVEYFANEGPSTTWLNFVTVEQWLHEGAKATAS